MILLPKRSPDTVPIISTGPVNAVTLPWRLVPAQDVLVVVAKLTLAIGSDGSVVVSEDPLPASGDELFDPDDETSSLRYPSDFEPFKSRADVVLVGHAVLEPGQRVARAGFGFGKSRWTLAAMGDRSWRGGSATDPDPSPRIPLRWERAFGGPGHQTNPVGRGFAEGAASTRLPNLERETQLIRSPSDRPAPICFAPVRREWTLRTGHAGTYDARWLDERWPYYPEDFDWAACNSAPAEQQIAYPRGDEAFEFFGLRAEAPVLSGRLPGMRPRVIAQYVESHGFRQQEVGLNLDTIWFDSDALLATLVWRGFVPVSSEWAPEIGLLFACVDAIDEPAALPTLREKLSERLGAAGDEESGPLSRTLGFGRSLFGSLENTLETVAVESAPLSEAVGFGRSLFDESESPSEGKAAMSREEVEALAATGLSFDDLDLSYCDLSGLSLPGRSMRRAVLTGARLLGTNLDGAALEHASLAGARARGATFRGADLSHANLSAAKLTESSFEGAVLEFANCDDVDAARSNLDRVQARLCSFSGARLSHASFRSANVEAGTFESAELEQADFSRANLTQTKFYEASARGARFEAAVLEGLRADEADLAECTFNGVDARGASFQLADLERADLSTANLDDAVLVHVKGSLLKLDGCRARRARFDGAELGRASLVRANLMQANFTGANLHGANLQGANLFQAEFWKTRYEDALFDGAFVRGTKLAQ